MTDENLKGVDGIDCANDEKHDLELLGLLATSYLDPFLEEIQWQDEPQLVKVCRLIIQIIHLKHFVICLSIQSESCHRKEKSLKCTRSKRSSEVFKSFEEYEYPQAQSKFVRWTQEGT